LPKLISKLEVYFGFEAINSLILKAIIKTDSKISLILPIVPPEILSNCSEYAFQKRNVKFVLISHWVMKMYGNILSKMILLGNIQIRQLASPAFSFGIFKDENELILAPMNEDLNELMCIRSTDTEFIKFLGSICIPIFNAISRPY